MELEQIKVVFPIEEGAEVLWCDELGDQQYRIDNVPLFAYGVSLGDVVAASISPDDPRPHFDRVLRKSGNKTCRVVIAEGKGETPAVLRQLDSLEKISNGSNRYGPEYRAFNFACADYEKAKTLLNTVENDGLWEWELSSEAQDAGDNEV